MSKNMIANVQEFDKDTGAITKAIVFHTRFNTVSEPGEHYEPNTSMTDATQFEPIQSLINRIVRPRGDLVYDELEDPTDGADLADLSDIMDDVQASIIAKQSVADPVGAATPSDLGEKSIIKDNIPNLTSGEE